MHSLYNNHHGPFTVPAEGEANDNLLSPGSSPLNSIDQASLISQLEASDFLDFDLSTNLDPQSPVARGDYPISFRELSSTNVPSTASLAHRSTRDTAQPLIHVAAQNGNSNIIQMLINHGVGVNARDSSGRTALHTAVHNRHDGAVRVLLQNEADVHACDREGDTPLSLAVKIGFEDAVQLLLYKTLKT